MSRGLFIGRFQPFHNGHYKAIKDILKDEDEVIICVAASQISFTISNPFSCGERIEMILRSLKDIRDKIIILSSPNTESNSLWVDNIVDTFPKFETVYTNNNLVRLLWEKRGYNVSKVNFYQKNEFNGTSIRKFISLDQKWDSLVPPETMKYIKEIEGEKRIKDILEIEEKLRDGAF
ncbi:MAG: Nicotinamide-nucleotide adenylyltransferase [Candidatus Methanofastidiosum methylothiophilum]|uniref:Nicotinamide-nucleotide adenylyltransferase n=1 Tax=Candidatus Methanofastidiosum methylothiophilum TaxID=1705564 RepID=A0A150IXY0_9EURY|nr:MAG: Nicotinamide-nucleotide adenylyltransferase [Candidatus Methanofastidiosum methylthiophilus]KYC46547.1 MAG: Nicotinamide-nucleotide adenylyltransferase [Candidatus Methanofastidiosum methylthiophilus]KYC49718.1 MAG: Nicotinamide-nucleotide adenylyltransferase [Candidatus Methanofastidiosum methylthiophilus]